jgi:hypothetical protein
MLANGEALEKSDIFKPHCRSFSGMECNNNGDRTPRFDGGSLHIALAIKINGL